MSEPTKTTTLLVTIDEKFRQELEAHRVRLEKAHAERGAPKEVSLHDVFLDAAQLGMKTIQGVTWMMQVAKDAQQKKEGPK